MAARVSFSKLFSGVITIVLVARRLTRGTAPAQAHAIAPPGAVAPHASAPQPIAPAGRPDEADAEQRRSQPPKKDGPRQPKYKLLFNAVSRFMDDDCTTMSAALAYYTTFSIAPLLLIVISVVGLIFGRQAVQHQIQTQIQGLIGQGPASQVNTMVQSAGQHSSKGLVSVVLGIVALIAGATGAFTQLQSSLNRVFRVKPDPNAGGVKKFLGQRILSLGMILAVAFLLVVSLAVSAALSAFGSYATSLLPKGFSAPLLAAIELVVSLAIVAALFASMFKVLPDAKIRWRDVWIGAGLTSLLFTIGKFLIGLYLGHSGAAGAYGAAGSLVLIVLWVNYSALIFLLGAELTAIWAETYSGAVQPKPGAVKVETEEKLLPQQAA